MLEWRKWLVRSCVLFVACRRLHREDGAIAKTLVDTKASFDKGGDPRTTRLSTAAMCGDAVDIQSLLQYKASIDPRESIFEATPLY